MASYDPLSYWTAAGADPNHPEHLANFRRTAVYARQEFALLSVLSGLPLGQAPTILEAGVGWGRVAQLVRRAYPWARMRGFDLSEDRLVEARRRVPGANFEHASILTYDGPQADLVLAVEVLMHVPPETIARCVDRLLDLGRRYFVSLDWTEDLGDAMVAPWNVRHDYQSLFRGFHVKQHRLELQSIFVVELE